jgi:excisionase family DNA binding protein
MAEIKAYEVYTSKETEELLKISSSTLKRLLKTGLLRANKIGGQYRILGHELLRLLSPKVDKRVTRVYQTLKTKAREQTKNW